MAKRPKSVPNPVWFRSSMTGIFHADPDCRFIADSVREAGGPFWRLVYELDRATSTAYLWLLDGLSTDGWVRMIDAPDPYKFSHRPQVTVDRSWRACLRCGSLRSDGTYVAKGSSADGPPVCQKCFLTKPCECDE